MRDNEEKAKILKFPGNKRRNNNNKKQYGATLPHWNAGRWAHSARSGSEEDFEPVVRRRSQSSNAPLIGEQRR